MGLFRNDSNQDNDDFSVDPEITSAFASYEAALREALDTGQENVAEKRNPEKATGERPKINLDLSRFRRAAVVIVILLVVLTLAWAFGIGPLSPYVHQMIAQLNERAMQPLKTETTAPTQAVDDTSSPSQSEPALSLPIDNPTATMTFTPTFTATAEASPTPTDTETPTPEPTATSSVAGCVPASSITLADVGRELCVTANVFKAEIFETYFSVRTGEDFYYVSYAKGWYKDYGVTWEFKKGDCVYAEGLIEKIGSYPLMQVGYNNPLKLCEAP